MRYDVLKCKASLRRSDSAKPQVLYAIPMDRTYRVVLQWHETEEPEKWVDLPRDFFDVQIGDRGRDELLLKEPLEVARQSSYSSHPLRGGSLPSLIRAA
jgi:hypothetical protein